MTGNSLLPQLSQGQSLNLQEASHEKKATQPPPRYSEAKLVQPTFRRLVSKVNNIFGKRNRGKTEYGDVQGLS